MARYLFGPVAAAFAEQHLQSARVRGDCLAFNAAGDTDLTIGLADSWETVQARLPPGWQADLVVLYLPHTTVPAGLWSAPLPLVGLATNWDRCWHAYRRSLRRCELILTDAAGAEVMVREGLDHVRPVNLAGEVMWDRVLEAIGAEWPRLVERSRQRPALVGWDDLLARTHQLLASADAGDGRLATDLATALIDRPLDAALHNALGLAVARAAQAGGQSAEARARTAAGYFRRALAAEPRHVLAALNLAEAFVVVGDRTGATESARRALAVLEQEADDLARPRPQPAWPDEGRFPPEFDWFRIEWERVAWEHAGQPDQEIRAKRSLVRCRLHTLLAEVTSDLSHYHEAALARPDLPVTRAALGCALARAGRFPEAAAHLRHAVDADPFDLPAARALFSVLGEVADRDGRRRLAQDRRRLHQANPARVPAESWFREVAAAGETSLPEPASDNASAGAKPNSPPPARGGEDPAPVPQPAAPVLVTGAGGRPRVSLCMIVKNEEANLSACLETVAGLVEDTVVVDTGSTDQTREIAARHHARVLDFPWVDSFAAVRNESLKHATGAWIFWLDADDRLDAVNRERLQAFFAGLGDENAAYVMKCLCLPAPGSDNVTVVDHVRVFRNHPEIRWQYRVHEQILPAVRRLGGEVRWTDAVIHHAGYQDAALRGRKLERDLRLLRLENDEHPDDPFTLFNLGSVYQELRQPADALPLLRRSLERSHPADSIVRKLHALVAQCYRQLRQLPEARAACRAGLRYYPEDTELLFLEGVVQRELGDWAGAEAAWLRLLAAQEPSHFASIDAGLRGPKTRQNLAALFEEDGRYAEAEAQWQAVAAEQPNCRAAWLGLANLYLGQRRWAELETVVGKLEEERPKSADAAVLRARRHLAHREFAAARRILDVAILQEPQAVWPRVILSHVLLQEGQDWAAAEQALRNVLAVDPGHVEARRNLGVLLQQLGRSAV
jgi:tetratricopeptide (TPR) repeat protein